MIPVGCLSSKPLMTTVFLTSFLQRPTLRLLKTFSSSSAPSNSELCESRIDCFSSLKLSLPSGFMKALRNTFEY